MKSDRELLELATKAYGINPIGWHDFNGILYEDQNGVKKWFNPRDEDGDSMRLAVRLKIDILNDDSFCGANSGKLNFIVYEDHMDDPIMAVRRAILRAAAAIGEKMQ